MLVWLYSIRAHEDVAAKGKISHKEAFYGINGLNG